MSFGSIQTISYAQNLTNLAFKAPSNYLEYHLKKISHPALVRGLILNPQQPLEFNFIIDTGEGYLKEDQFREQAKVLIQYFMASLTIPEDQMWVNLSPYEQERIIPESLASTKLGVELLSQDYVLKKLTASLINPEKSLGKEFWSKIYQEAKQKYGTDQISVHTFNKVWIVPDKAVVYEHQGKVIIAEKHLKVLLEEDYLAMQKNKDQKKNYLKETNQLSAQITKEIIIPALEKEVNEGTYFANLRQIYNSMILAVWYKKNLKESLFGKLYINQNKVKGIDTEQKQTGEEIYAQYLKTFKKGVFNFIKEEYDFSNKKNVARKYFSGGFKGLNSAMISEINGSLSTLNVSIRNTILKPQGVDRIVTWQAVENLETNGLNAAMTSEQDNFREQLHTLIENNSQWKSLPKIAIFDVHGTLLKSNWKDQLAYAYHLLTGLTEEKGFQWVEENAIHVEQSTIIERLMRDSKKSKAEVEASLGNAHNLFKTVRMPEAMPGALDFIKALHERNIPIIIMSGSYHDIIVKQLQIRGFMQYINSEMIIGRDDMLRSGAGIQYDKQARYKAIESLLQQYPGHTIIHFNDWVGGVQAVKRLKGITFGIAQGKGEEYEANRRALLTAGVDLIMDKWTQNAEIIMDEMQIVKQTKPVIKVSEGPAREIPLVLPAKRHGGFKFHINVHPDLQTLTYSEILDDSKVFAKDGTVDYTQLKLQEIATFPSSHLISPLNTIRKILKPEQVNRIEQLWSTGKRITSYDGVTTTGDQETDLNVWATSIDSVFLHKSIQEAGLLDDPIARNVVEIGVGGGHLSTLLASRMPQLKQISLTDINLYALQTSLRNVLAVLPNDHHVRIRQYLGKGIEALDNSADLIVVNPPYLPIPPFENADETDPYRGTGLIREIIKDAKHKLNPDNPHASIVINISSAAQKDFDKYMAKFGKDLLVEKISQPIQVPLKIRWLSKEWEQWMVSEGGVEKRENSDYPFWHTLTVYRMRLKTPSTLIKPEIVLQGERKTSTTIQKKLRLAAAQVNLTVGDIKGNKGEILKAIEKAKEKDADIVVFPEMSILGYPPEDLVYKRELIRRNKEAMRDIARQVKGITAVVGFVDYDKDWKLYNAAAIISDGQIKHIYHKKHLPNYGQFDEKRYFTSGGNYEIYMTNGVPWSLNICEDIWIDDDISLKQAQDGAKLLINMSASPFHYNKLESVRKDFLPKRARETNAHIVYTNLVGGQDELVFDGGSLIYDPKGKVIAQAKQFGEDLLIKDITFEVPSDLSSSKSIVLASQTKETKVDLEDRALPESFDEIDEVYQALVLGVRDYLRKSGFKKIVFGNSGGIDSVLTAKIAVDAIGSENVLGLSMPTKYNSDATKSDARKIAENLGIGFKELPIEEDFTTVLANLKKDPEFAALPEGTTEENIQPRLRMIKLMAYSNKFGYLVLNTTNRSEAAVGYGTLYGDVAGGLAVLKDVPKTMVYKIARRINDRAKQEIIPYSVINRPPSAELKPDQKDQDSLPPYDILDPIIDGIMLENLTIPEMIERWPAWEKHIRRTVKLFALNEYKRRQSPPGINITRRAFGKPWRIPIGMPITSFDPWLDDNLSLDSAMSASMKSVAHVAHLNKERPLNYPMRSIESPPFYFNTEINDHIKTRENPHGYAHQNLNDPKLSLADQNQLRAHIRNEIHRFAPHTKFFNGLPRNRQETGLNGRGDLGRYGPNPAEDAIILRYNKEGQLEVLVIDRIDGGGIALPGVLIPFGQENQVGVAATRRLKEETNVEIDMTKGTVVYQGPAQDWRDTNDAWVITRGIAKILSYDQSLYLKIEAKQGAKPNSARFVPVAQEQGYYARHKAIIKEAVRMVQSGQIQTDEQKSVKKHGPLHITLTQIEKAYQAFREGKLIEQNQYDLIAPQAPHGGNYIVAAGLEVALSDLRQLRFTPEHIDALRKEEYFSEEFLNYLRNFIFEGDIDALQEGRIVAPNIPLMRIKANAIDIELIGDILKNRIGFSSNIATKTARIVQAANGDFVSEEAIDRLWHKKRLARELIKKSRDVIDMGLRRGQGPGAFLASRSTIIGGAIGTSNMRSAHENNLKTIGSMAHLFITAFAPDEEIDAFRLYVKLYPENAILLVDTYDTLQGIRNAIIVAKEMEARSERLLGIRLDSGDLVDLSEKARKMLDDVGLHYVKIIASDDLDEHKITSLLEQGAQIDIFGVGTNLITGGKQASLGLSIVPSNGKRIWRSSINGKVEKYIITEANRTVFAAADQEIEEILFPIWRSGQRVFGVSKPGKAREQTLKEISYLTLKQKNLVHSADIAQEEQNNPLTINPQSDAFLDIDDEATFKLKGGLPVKDGDKITNSVKGVMQLFPKNRRFASLDKHPRGGISWASSFVDIDPYTFLTYDEVKDWTLQDHRIAEHALFTLEQLKERLKKRGGQMLWPDHAKEQSHESELDSHLLGHEFEYILIKGMDPTVDSYSAFFDNMGRPTGLADQLRKRGIKRIFMTGLAYDYCVGWSALDAIKEGFEVIIVKNATRSVGAPQGSIENIEASFKEMKVQIVEAASLITAVNNHSGVTPATKLSTPIAHPPIFIDEEESSALEEDKYHLTMAQAFFEAGMKYKNTTFDYFFRKAPYGSDRIIFSGLRFFVEQLRKFKFTQEQIEYLRKQKIYSEDFLNYLMNFRFSGDIQAIEEGSIGFAHEPLIRIKGPIIEAMIIESMLLNKVNFNSLIATLANLTRLKAPQHTRFIENGLSGAQGDSHAQASYSAFIGGTDVTTNIDAHNSFDIPLAWSNDDGLWLGSDFITGGEKSSLGGVLKLSMFDRQARIKLSENPDKTSLPGDKEIVDILDNKGKVIRRMIVLEGQEIPINSGEQIERMYQTIVKSGDIVYIPKDIWHVQAFRELQNVRYVGIHASDISGELKQLRDEMIKKSKPSLKSLPNIKTRFETPSDYPDRQKVSNEEVLWENKSLKYAPPFYEKPYLETKTYRVIPQGYADPVDFQQVLEDIREGKRENLLSFEGEIRIDPSSKLPLNPSGRTGIRGRGDLGKYGPNMAADILLTRLNSQTKKIEALLITRPKTGQYAFSGGFRNRQKVGERIYLENSFTACLRELYEETKLHINSLDLTTARSLYRGFVDDPRNTDNAWIETEAWHIHVRDSKRAMSLVPQLTQESLKTHWVAIDDIDANALYASHGDLLKRLKGRLERDFAMNSPSTKPNTMSDDFSIATDVNSLNKPLSDTQKEILKKRLNDLNPGYDPLKLFSMMTWDIGQFEYEHLPSVVGDLIEKDNFSKAQGLRILDMAVRMPKQGWAIPKALEQFREVLEMASTHERLINPDFDEKYYVYITVDQKIVEPHQTQRRPGWHGDAYVSSETSNLVDSQGNPNVVITDNTYVVSNALSTLFLPGPFSLKGVDAEDIREVLRRFDETAKGKMPLRYPGYRLLRMTPYDLHTPDTNHLDQTIQRTFVKIQFSRDRLNREGNAINPLLNYDGWIWVPRGEERNNRNVIVGWDRADKDEFQFIDPLSVDFNQDSINVPWAKNKFFWGVKTEGVKAQKAKEGEALTTMVDGFPLTKNISKPGDWKITTSQGDQYFLSHEKFQKRYQLHVDDKGIYPPISRPVKMLEIVKPIRFRASWGVMEYVPAGSVLVNLGDGDVYAIHRENFYASYQQTNNNDTSRISSSITTKQQLKQVLSSPTRLSKYDLNFADTKRKTWNLKLQIPQHIELTEQVKQITFVLDVDSTLASVSRLTDGITQENLNQLIRAFRLMRDHPQLKIRFIINSANMYNPVYFVEIW